MVDGWVDGRKEGQVEGKENGWLDKRMMKPITRRTNTGENTLGMKLKNKLKSDLSVFYYPSCAPQVQPFSFSPSPAPKLHPQTPRPSHIRQCPKDSCCSGQQAVPMSTPPESLPKATASRSRAPPRSVVPPHMLRGPPSLFSQHHMRSDSPGLTTP